MIFLSFGFISSQRMGVGHDDSSSGCANHVNLMASTISIGPGSMKWSACSRERFQDFLRYTYTTDIPWTVVFPFPKEKKQNSINASIAVFFRLFIVLNEQAFN